MRGTSTIADHAWPPAAERALNAITFALALCVLAFLYCALGVDLLGLEGKGRDIALYFAAALAIPPVCAACFGFGRTADDKASAFADLHIGLATICLTAFCLLAAAVQLFGLSARVWSIGATAIGLVTAVLNVTGLAALLLAPEHRMQALRPKGMTVFWLSPVQTIAFATALSLALFLLFRMQPERGVIHPAFGLLAYPLDLAVGLTAAAAATALIVMLGLLEMRQASGPAARLRLFQVAGLCIAILLLVVFFFDFSLPAEPLHYLTNVSPALQLRHGGVLMVDTFSQYGPGPVLVTLIGLQLGPDTLATGNLTAQALNFAYVALWMVCLYRISSLRLPALASALGVVAIFLATWGLGASNIAFAPSILGFRYLPALLMVAALSFLRPPRRYSFWTAAAIFIATLWSVEAAVGTLGIHMAFAGMLALRDRAWSRLVLDGFAILLPAAAAILALFAYTYGQAGVAPDFATYLGFLSVYNFFSPYWSIPANPLFFGWAALLAPVLAVLIDGWVRIFFPARAVLSARSATLYYRLIPMALLGLLTSTYFIGRSVDYTVVLALLPVAALVIPAALHWAAVCYGTAQWHRLGYLGLPMAAFVIGLTFAVPALLHPSGPYSFLYHQCLYLGRCAPASIGHALGERLHGRQVMEYVGNTYSDGYFDAAGVVRDAVRMMENLAPDQERVTVLLGPVRNIKLVGDIRDQIASDAALLYAGKWHRWPRSNSFTDELLPARIEQILAAPVSLDDGELVLVRRDEQLLGAVETGILAMLRNDVTLCKLPDSTVAITAYRVSRKGNCAGG